MAVMKCILGLLALFAVSAWTEAGMWRSAEAENDLTVSEQLGDANDNLSPDRDGIHIDGDIAVSRLPTLRNADPCVRRGCMWPKATDNKVYVPYAIANHYSPQEIDLIKRGLNSFSYSTCIRFFPRTNQRDYLYIQSLDGCYSYVGRQGNTQTVSLSRRGCIYYGTIQHELLHALGFNHEQCRSDRDQHIQVILQNVMKGQEHNFRKIDTLNQGTPYDYGSVMHYGRTAFSKDNYSPTMVAIPNRNAVFGTAKQMSQNDINRINLLYCRN
ncbi:high choriolytic enzyme 1-like [Sphaeramia orbicularis]|uniref:high choriolytic enzyme 1-like n=1 Tax=Sphaeramia orbicularis TaxID=375764 RepID=UPI00117C9787|nr:high choriolytic enzyme 1-like [Sphaeramia orbicularis]